MSIVAGVAESRKFYGEWITNETAAKFKPINVFHRQLDKVQVRGGLDENLHLLFRKKFIVSNCDKTTIFITADDYYKLYINGRFVTQGPAPGFPFHYYYNEIDITPYVKVGENMIAVHTYYQGLINRVWVSGDDRHGLLFDVVQNQDILAKSDHTVKQTIHTGYKPLGKTGSQTQFMEQYDSGSAQVGFEENDYDDSEWGAAVIHPYAEYRLFAQPTRQLVMETLQPVSLRKDENGYLVDFGSMYVGYLSAIAEGKKGDKIVVRCGQELAQDGEVSYVIRANCQYEEEWILSGKEDTLQQYDYKSFRYCRLIVPEGVILHRVEMVIRHYPFELKRECLYKDENLQKIWNLCVNTLKYGVQDVIQDCMDREKGQYLGDGSFSAAALAVLTEDTSIMEKMIDDALRTNFVNQGLMTCSPCSFMQEIAEYPLMLPQLFLAHWQLKKDLTFLEERYDKLIAILEFYRHNYATENGLIGNLDKWCVVDWPKECRDGYDFDLTQGRVTVGIHNVINAYYIGAIKAVNKLAQIIKKPPYRETSSLQNAYLQAFYDTDRKLFRDTPVTKHVSLPSNAFALMYALCPDKETEENIVKLIFEKDAASSAFFTTFACLCGLYRTGRKEEVLRLLLSPDRWLRMLEEGATVTYEAWGKDVKWNTSLFHLCYSFPVLFLTEWGMADIWEEENVKCKSDI